MNVLSLFDGISGAQQALQRANIKYDSYYASEIDKFAIKATMHNFPNTIQLGSVVDVDVSKLPPIHMLFGGSPCQSFSFAGKRKGMSTIDSIEILTLDHYLQLKQEGYAFEGQSYLFWEYMRILTDIRKLNPDVKFLLENVEMGNKWERVLSRAIGVDGIHINSTLVSAQNRKRIYWTNIGLKAQGLWGDMVCMIPQPQDKKIFLMDILESNVAEKYYLKQKSQDYVLNLERIKKSYTAIGGDKSLPLMSYYNNSKKGTFLIADQGKVVGREVNKSHSLMARDYKGFGNQEMVGVVESVYVAQRGRNPDNPTSRVAGLPTKQMIEPAPVGKTNCLTSVQKDNLVLENKVIQLNNSTESGGTQPYQQNRVYSIRGKSPTLMDATNWQHKLLESVPIVHNMTPRSSTTGKGGTGHLSRIDDKAYCLQTTDINRIEYRQRIRRFTPIECCRLQTVNDNYFKDSEGNNVISESQQYKMLGNGWTIEVIVHILSYLQ